MQFKSLFSVFLLLQGTLAYVNMAYYSSWRAYATQKASDVNTAHVTHLLYAFLNVKSDGTVQPANADIDVTGNLGDSKNAYGNVQALYKMKQKNRKLRTLLSIGGDGGRRQMMLDGVKNGNNRKRFIKSSIDLMLNWGFDGIDLDFEFPESKQEGEWFYTLIKELRTALNAKSKELKQSYHYILTAAVGVGANQHQYLPLAKMNSQLDFFNLMGYDYSGNWGSTAHNSNIYQDKKNLLATPANTDAAVTKFIKAGVSSNKIVIGMTLQANVFKKTAGLGKKFTGFETAPFKSFPRKGATVYERPEVGSIITYDKNKKEVVSLEGAASIKMKAKYVKSKKLAGHFFWDVYNDKTGTSSLVYQSKVALGSMQNTNNQLSYPSSKYANIKSGMKSKRDVTLRWAMRDVSEESDDSE